MKKACMALNEAAVWTLTYTPNRDGTITIENFDSQDNDGYLFFDQLDKLESIEEIEGRVADKVVIAGKTYEVRNKQNVFTYKQPL